MTTDRIEKQIVLHAPLDRVWRAISDAGEFGSWFGAEIDGAFVAGAAAIGRIVPTKVDPAVARLQEPHRGAAFMIMVTRIEPPRCFAFRWHPLGADPAPDGAPAPTTLVTFELAEIDAGVLLTISESGFDGLPPARRAAAWQANDSGWDHQARLIALYLAQTNAPAGA